MSKTRYKLILEYVGTNFCGWQKQKDKMSVQFELEKAIAIFTKELVNVFGASRTDSGVHAYCQVAHFELEKFYDPYKIKTAINHYVKPEKIVILECTIVENNFHARFSVEQKEYLYKILNRNSPSAIDSGQKYLIKYPILDIENMQSGANYLIGKHDFSAFKAKGCQSKSPIKTLDSIHIEKFNDTIHIHVKAKSFLYKMVRNIVGTLILVGKNKYPPYKMQQILLSKNRNNAGPTVPALGLYLFKIRY